MGGGFLVLVAVTIYFLTTVPGTLAQAAQSQVIITWQANNFFPSDFQGKAMPTFGTPITVSAEALVNSKFFDLSKIMVAWFVDGTFAGQGVGLKEFTFPNAKSDGDFVFVRAVAKLTDQNLEGSARIPVVTPRIVFENSPAGGVVRQGASVFLTAIPYFFNVSSLDGLSFSWVVDTVKQNTITQPAISFVVGAATAPGSALPVSVLVQNIGNPIEYLTADLNLVVQP